MLAVLGQRSPPSASGLFQIEDGGLLVGSYGVEVCCLSVFSARCSLGGAGLPQHSPRHSEAVSAELLADSALGYGLPACLNIVLETLVPPYAGSATRSQPKGAGWRYT